MCGGLAEPGVEALCSGPAWGAVSRGLRSGDPDRAGPRASLPRGLLTWSPPAPDAGPGCHLPEARRPETLVATVLPLLPKVASCTGFEVRPQKAGSHVPSLERDLDV